MKRASSRRFGAVDFGKHLLFKTAGVDILGSLVDDALKEAQMTREDDFHLRLVVYENLPEGMPERKK